MNLSRKIPNLNFMRDLLFWGFIIAATSMSVTTLDAKESVIREFYKILSAPEPPSEQEAITLRLSRILTELWETTPPLTTTLPTATPRTALIKQIQDFHQNIPDLKWEPLDIIKAPNQTYTVISKVSGTPQKSFFGVMPSGKKFEVLTIDVHILEKARIKTSYHVEDWINAVHQLTSAE